MTYPIIPSRRMPYDIDGTEVGYRIGGNFGNGIASWLSSGQKGEINTTLNHTGTVLAAGFTTASSMLWFFFPEAREITHMTALLTITGTLQATVVAGSNNSTNGMDGDWEAAVLPDGNPATQSTNLDIWRTHVRSVSFSEPKKIVRCRFLTSGTNARAAIRRVFVYGSKAAGQTPDDILIMTNTTDEFTALKDWGDRPEGTVELSSFRLKNASTTKTANNINVQLNHDDFLISWSDTGPWVTFVDIASLSPGAVSSPIYVKNELPPPLLILGPRAARVVVGVGSWT